MQHRKDAIIVKMEAERITTGEVARECGCQSSFIGQFLTEGIDDMGKKAEEFWVKRIESAVEVLAKRNSVCPRSAEVPGIRFEENKQEICQALCKALQKTRAGRGVISITYKQGDEVVTVLSINGVMNINVACDSGIAMLRDILRQFD